MNVLHSQPAPHNCGARVFLLALLLLVFAAAPGSATPAGDCPDTVKELLAGLAGQTEKRARFREEKFLEILTEPVRAQGTLLFRAPDYLEKNIETPQRERMVATAGQVTIERPDLGEKRTLSLEHVPALQGLLNGLRFTLAGNGPELERYYKITFRSACPGWELALSPRDPSLTEWVKRILISGRGAEVRQVKWIDPEGGLTVMTLEPAAP